MARHRRACVHLSDGGNRWSLSPDFAPLPKRVVGFIPKLGYLLSQDQLRTIPRHALPLGSEALSSVLGSQAL